LLPGTSSRLMPSPCGLIVVVAPADWNGRNVYAIGAVRRK
jgi:hypothetical protein